MDIKQLKYFISITDCKGFSNAAKKLFITQPTLSQAIKKLETELHTTLFQPHTHSLTLTPSGQILYEEGKKIVSHIDLVSERIKNLNRLTKESIRIGIPTLFAMRLMPIFSDFMISHPEVDITMVQGGSYELQRELQQGTIDLGVFTYPNYPKDIKISHFKKEFLGFHACVVLPKDHPLANRKSLTYADISDQPFSSLSKRFLLGRLLLMRSRELGFIPNIVYTDDNWEVLLSSLNSFNSICIMALEYQPYYPNDDVVWVQLDDPKTFFQVGLAYRQDREYSDNVKELIKRLQAL